MCWYLILSLFSLLFSACLIGGITAFYLQIEGKGIKPIQEEAKQRNVDLKTFKVTQVSFGLKFPGKGRKGSVTMELTAPDKCNLNESNLHKRAKQYIAYWGLDYQATDQDPS